MSDRILPKYVGRNGAIAESLDLDAIGDAEDVESFDCFGWLRGMRERAVCLEFRQKSGSVLAIPYAYISRMEFQPSGLITILLNDVFNKRRQ